MKRLFIIIILFSLFVSGCSSSNNIKKNIIKKYDNIKGYKLKGELSINNNDDVYNYSVSVGYKRKDLYRVVLTNKSNGYEQIILKNGDGVYVLTPSLNKSFKFNSDWPYNNSSIYLLDAIINDIKSDDKSGLKRSNNKYSLTTKVKYSNNSKFVRQVLDFDKSLGLKKAIVYDKDGVWVMSMKFNSVKITSNFPRNYFSVDGIIDKDKDTSKTKSTGGLNDVIYPLFLPSGTKLVDEEKISKDNGERVIMTYDGEKSFLLVEETLDVFNEFTVIPSSGEPFMLMDTLGVMTNNSLSWESGNVEYYLVSDVMSRDEMLEVARSIGNVDSVK